MTSSTIPKTIPYLRYRDLAELGFFHADAMFPFASEGGLYVLFDLLAGFSNLSSASWDGRTE